MKFKLSWKIQIFLAAKIIYQKKAGHNIPTLFYHKLGDLDWISLIYLCFIFIFLHYYHGSKIAIIKSHIEMNFANFAFYSKHKKAKVLELKLYFVIAISYGKHFHKIIWNNFLSSSFHLTNTYVSLHKIGSAMTRKM